MFTPITLTFSDELNSELGEQVNASALFERISGRNLIRSLRNRLTQRCDCLESLSNVEHETRRRTYSGLRLVPISQIRGTEGRESDFDADFRPLQAHDKERWMGILIAMRRGVSMPPVQLIQVGQTYYVRDGHHRISVAKQLGRGEIDAEVTVWE